MKGVQLVWFKRDLRTVDHTPLTTAAGCGPVLPLYVVEPDLWRQPDASGRQWAFAAESLRELRDDLATLGQPLVVRIGDVIDVLDALDARHGLAAIHMHQETGNAWTHARDKRVRAWAYSRGVACHEHRQDGVIRGLHTRDGWARRWDRFMARAMTPPPRALPEVEREIGSIPGSPGDDPTADPCPLRQVGGRRAGRALLDSFLQERGRDYRTAMSSPVTAFDACSRLSPHFAWGTVPVREAALATWSAMREARAPWRGALRSFEARLHWHCHFKQKLEDAPSIEWANLHPVADRLARRDDPDDPRLHAWMSGVTGLPFVDACMRALIAHGWLNFRMRAMLMAVASYHLWLHWRRPGLHLARLFTDYEAGIHWSQCQMQAGTTGINTPRIYNPVKQGRDHDPDGCFIRTWVPELRDVPRAHVHEPWTWPDAARLLGTAYPHPVVDHRQAAREARRAIAQLRAAPEARAEADAIQACHGSRKSGIRAGQRAASAQSDTRQKRLNLEEPNDDPSTPDGA